MKPYPDNNITARVSAIKKDCFTACAENGKRLTFDFRDVSPSDLDLLKPGAIFYIFSSHRDTAAGQREFLTGLRFARRITR